MNQLRHLIDVVKELALSKGVEMNATADEIAEELSAVLAEGNESAPVESKKAKKKGD
jgi:hypothetical protein